MDKKLLVLTGPTGVGKTALSLKMAEELGCPIISCDSRQMYKGIPIGTAAPTPEEQARVKHYFVSFLDLQDNYSAGRYEQDCISLLSELFKQHNTLIMTGGSMLYTVGITPRSKRSFQKRRIRGFAGETESVRP